MVNAMSNKTSYTHSVWIGRFTVAAIVQGFILTLILAIFGGAQYLSTMSPAIANLLGTPLGTSGADFAHVMAAGQAGTWFSVGLFAYLVVGVVATAITGLYYQYLETTLNKPMTVTPYNYLAWFHLLASNIGIFGVSMLMMYGGYFGEAGLLDGTYATVGEVHIHVLGALVDPITYFMGILTLGVLVGGLGYVMRWLNVGIKVKSPDQ